PETHDVRSGAEPHASVPRLQEELADRSSTVTGVSLQLPAGTTRYAPYSVDPKLAFGILVNGRGDSARQAVARGECNDSTLMQPDETTITTDPQLSGAACIQRSEQAGAETRDLRRAENSEAHAIETREAPICG